MILVIESRATKQQLDEMLQARDVHIKLTVDIERGTLAGGGALHADCEIALLEAGSEQDNIWGVETRELMNERVFHGDVERLRSPARLAALEVERVLDLTLEGIAARNVLDVGTGTGVFAERFAGRGLNVAGVDARADMVAQARQFVPQGRFEVAPAEALPFPDASFDLVFLGLVLHEADDAFQMLAEARRVSRRRVVALEWPYEEGPVGPPLAHRLTQAQVESLAREAGFAGIEAVRLTYVLVYRMDR